MRASKPTRLIPLLAVLAALAAPAPALASFGVEDFRAEALNQNGTLDTQAGSHPYEAVTAFTFQQGEDRQYPEQRAGNVKNVEVALPPGFIGNPQAVPQCAEAEFNGADGGELPPCPGNSQVGIATVVLGGQDAGTEILPVYNLMPKDGSTATFGFSVFLDEVPVQIAATVDSARGYVIDTHVADVAIGSYGTGLLPLIKVTLTFWGTPADPTHDAQRDQVCYFEEHIEEGCHGGNEASDASLLPFLMNSTDCHSGSLTTTLRVDSWQEPAQWLTYTAQSPQPTGCEKLVFHPTIEVEPETTAADAPSGYTFRVKVPQNPNTYGLGTPELDNAKVTLPRGVSIDPSAASGLAGCTNEEIGIDTEDPVACPAASKLGTVDVFTPLLADGPNGEAPLSGSIYLGTPVAGEEYRIFLAIEGHGVQIRLPGRVTPDLVTGQITATFEENPPLPFSELVLHFFGGPRAALANPLTCGPATTTSDLTPYGSPEVPDVTPASTFDVTDCGNPPAFAPTLTAGTAPSTAGGYGTFSFQLARSEGQQYISQIQAVSLPPGLLGDISTVPLCAAAQAAAGTCGSLSEIGQVTVGAGPGSTPFYLGGRVYLTEGYDGDPFGFSIVVPAIAGPYNLGTVIVRAGIAVNPKTAAITVQADPVPTILEGIPLRLRYIGITIDRPSFILNPTNCSQQTIAATIDAQQGATASPSSPFFATGCASLPFKPIFLASTQGVTNKASGASLTVHVASSQGPSSSPQAVAESDIHEVKVTLPKALPARLTTLQKACTAAQFEANPAGCPAASAIGTATAHTPILGVPLTGPAYLVSHGGAAFPDVEVVLQGNERGGVITIILDGKTDIKNGITTSDFSTVPDAPVTSFELNLPEGPHSVLAAPGGSLCGQNLEMPTRMVGQNGFVQEQNTLIAVTGCGPALYVASDKVSGKTVTVAVTVPSAGTITASGNGLSKSSSKPGQSKLVALTLELRKAQAAKLSKKKRVNVKIKLSFVPKTGKKLTKTVSVTFKPPAKAKAKATAKKSSNRNGKAGR